MPLVETHVRLPCVGMGAFGLFKLELISRVAGERVRLRAVRKVVDVFRADDVDELERGLAAAGLDFGLTLSRRLGLSGKSSGC